MYATILYIFSYILLSKQKAFFSFSFFLQFWYLGAGAESWSKLISGKPDSSLNNLSSIMNEKDILFFFDSSDIEDTEPDPGLRLVLGIRILV